MPHYMYVAVNEDNRISVFTVDPDGGGITHQHDVEVAGGPFTLAISPTASPLLRHQGNPRVDQLSD